MGHLITPEFEELFAKYPLCSQRNNKNPLVIAKLYDQFSPAVWFLTEYNSSFKLAFAYVAGIYIDEFGSVSIKELEKIKFSQLNAFKIKQDWDFTKKPLNEALKIY